MRTASVVFSSGLCKPIPTHCAASATFLFFLLVMSGCAGPVGQGNLALLQGDYTRAESIFLQALQEDPKNLTLRRRLAMTSYYMGRDQDATKFDQAVEQFRVIQSKRAMQPEEEFYYGLSLIGLGHREQGFAVLKSFRYPLKFRIQQYVQERAAQLEPYQELPARQIFTEMEKAWREGDEEDKRDQLEERKDDPFTRNSPVPLR